MSISIVNGYFCANSCDAAKAKKGENPHPSTDPLGSEPGRPDAHSRSARADGPAVTFGGALRDLNGITAPVENSQSAAPPSPDRPVIDLLA